ncbi:magnesium transporter [Collinsella ihumii]|uniref:CBS domain-containing protein n=1 Tax=Collinsella ihumii TaxID=1720204 RepID=A0AAW7JWK1_9ACTN|nr:CBS domain-containing protein [Collinsella ihumii]MDN0068960.1 CBS domain-containing protein [Collinsella ihumii]
MNYLSEMLKLPVVDSAGERIGIVNDLGIATGEVFPHVTSLAFQGPGKTPFMISWRKYVERFDDDGVYLKMPATDIRFSYLQPDEVLLARDIMNKQIVDTQGMKVVRVNDIKLSASGENQLRLLGAEVGVRGLLRTLHPVLERVVVAASRAVGKPLQEDIIAWSYMDLLERSTQTIKLSVSHKTLGELHPADIADIIEQLDPRLRGQVFAQLDTAQAAEAISELDDDELVAEMLEGLSDRDASSMLALMDPDDAAALIDELDYEKAEKLLRLMGVKEERAIRNLLGYEENTAGRIMTSEFVALPATSTVADAIDGLRKLDEDFESVYYVYTTDPAGALTGVLSLRTLIVADHDARLNSLAYRDVVWVSPDEDQEDVAEEMSKYNLAAMPVCDENRHILGIVTVDDAMEVMNEEHQEDLQIAGMAGAEGGSGESMHVFSWFARRQYWLLVWAIASGIIAAVLQMMGGLGSYFIYPMCVMPVSLLAASRVVSYVRNYYLEYDEADDEDKPYLAFFLQTVLVGAVLALVIYLCGQLVLGAAYSDDVLASASAGGWMPAAADPDGAVNALIGAARMLSACFACAAGVTFVSCALSVIYLKVLFWRDEHDLNTSGIALSVSAVLIARALYSVVSTLAVSMIAA